MKNRIGVTSNEITLIAFMFTSFMFFLTVNDSASNILMHFLTTSGFFLILQLEETKKKNFFQK